MVNRALKSFAEINAARACSRRALSGKTVRSSAILPYPLLVRWLRQKSITMVVLVALRWR